MQNIILSPVTFDQLKTAIQEAVKLEFSNLKDIAPAEQLEYITRNETAQILGVSLVTLNSWTKTGTLQGYRIGSRVRYKKNEVLTSVQKMQTLTFGRRP